MKSITRLFVFLGTILFTTITSNAAITPITQLYHQSAGGPSEHIAVKIGANYDTAFVSAGLSVKAIQISHSNPESPTILNSLGFLVPDSINSIAVSGQLILVGLEKGLIIRNYITGVNYTTPSGIKDSSITDATFDNEGDTAYVGVERYGFKIIDLANPASAALISSSPQDTILDSGSNYKGRMSLTFKSNGISDSLYLSM